MSAGISSGDRTLWEGAGSCAETPSARPSVRQSVHTHFMTTSTLTEAPLFIARQAYR